MGTKIYGYNRLYFTMTMADNASITATGGLGQSNGVWGVTDPADGIMDIRDFSWAAFEIVSGTWVAADVTYKAASTRAGTYSAIYDKDGTLVRSKVGANTAGWFALPIEAMMAGPFVKMNATNTGSAADVSETGGPMVFGVLVGA